MASLVAVGMRAMVGAGSLVTVVPRVTVCEGPQAAVRVLLDNVEGEAVVLLMLEVLHMATQE